MNMREREILAQAFAMPLTSPAYPPGPYRFVNREYLIITYRTGPARLRAFVPEPLELEGTNFAGTTVQSDRRSGARGGKISFAVQRGEAMTGGIDGLGEIRIAVA
jgi:hypothetical protein